MTPDNQDFWFIPLGGCGEIGMNMNLYGHDDQWLMVDCGVTFRDADDSNRSGFHVQMADPAFIEKQIDGLQGLILTHGHEDHIGAVPHLWSKLQCPVFATTFTAELLRRKLTEYGLDTKVDIRIVEPGDKTPIGVFEVEWVAHTHSIPDPCGVVIRTPVANVFHSADWKLDKAPQIGHHYQQSVYESIGDSGINALVCDSTCADQPGHSLSEGELYDGLLDTVKQASGRVVVACFGSNIARLHTLARVAEACDRHLGMLGRSLLNTVSAARTVDLWTHKGTVVDPAHLGYLPPESLLLVATGSQGEPRTALDRLSRNQFRELALESGDTVIFSARAIPGNEEAIESLMLRLRGLGVRTIEASQTQLPIHASGHPSVEELKKFYRWVQPELLIPVHGEPKHLQAQAAFAKSFGIGKQLQGKNGDLFIIAPTKAIRRNAVDTGRLGVERQSQKLKTIPL